MAETGNDQALAATFAFGTVAVAAIAAASLNLRGGTMPFFRDGLRLVLVGYLTTSFLWALVGFIATFIKMSAVPGCQAAVAFASVFDQLARISLQELLFWGIKCEIQASVAVLLPQGIFLLRFILGGIFIGLQRPQYNPVCVGTTLVVPIAVALLVSEAAIIVMLMVRASSVGIFKDMQAKTPAWPRGRSLLLITLALGLWTALSIPMILGIESFDLVVRTVLPAIGSLVAIVLVAVSRKHLRNSPQNTSQRPQMTQGPARDFPPAPRGLVTRNQDVPASYYSNPFTAPPQDAPSSSDSDRFFASRDGIAGLPIITRPSPGQADAGVGGVPVTGQLFPPIKAQVAAAAAKSSNERPTKKVLLKGGKVTISYPVPNGDAPEILSRVPTVDLATAAKNQKEQRKNAALQSSSSDSNGHPRALSLKEMQNQPQSFKRKEVTTSSASMMDNARRSPQSPEGTRAKGETSSAQISPIADNMRRRSPTRQAPRAPAPNVASVPTDKNHAAPDADTSKTPTSPGAFQSPREVEAQTRMESHEPKERAPSITASRQQSRSGAPVFTNPNPPPQIPRIFSGPTESVEVLVRPVPPLGSRASPEPSHAKTAIHGSSRGTLATLPRNGSVRADIRPSRQRQVSPPPPEEQPKSTKTPVQLRQMIGIPSNPRDPRARIPKPAHKDQVASQEPVHFGNGPEKEDSSAMRGILDQALKSIAEEPLRARAQDRESVVNRPRPVPRKPAVGHTSPSRGLIKPFQNISSRFSESADAETPAASESTAALPPSKFSANASLVVAGMQNSSPVASKDERRLKQVSSNVPDMSAATLPPLPTKEAERTKPFSRKDASATVRAPEAPGRDPRLHHSTGKFMSKFSMDTAFSVLDEQHGGLFEPLLVASQSYQSPQADKKIQPSPVIPADEQQMPVGLQDRDANESSTRDVQAPEPAARPRVESSSPKAEARMWLEPNDRRHMVESALLTDDDDEGKETMTVMLDVPVEPQSVPPKKQELAGSTPVRGSWHRRVGDKCPTFSDREEHDKRMTKTRLVPRPPPLPLNKPAKTRKVDTAELPPLETPKHALEKIQEQLNRLGEFVEPAAPESGRQKLELPQPKENLQRGISLLADIELEMGMQENRWQEMRRDHSRASMSTVASPPNTEPPSSAKLERMLSAAAATDAAGLEAPVGLDASTMSLGDLGHPFSSPSDLEKWALGGDENLSSVQALGIGSIETPVLTSPNSSSPEIHPHVPGSVNSFSDLSTDAAIQSLEPIPTREDLERPERSTSLSLEPVGVESPMLRSTPSAPTEKRTVERRRTIRPPRRSKRMSSLPDILEDPVPMVGKRGTLGLFQFPWGERSDSASVPLSSQMQAAMRMSIGMGIPVNMAPGLPPVFPTLDGRARTLQSQDYPSSFFDDYDDDQALGDEHGASSDDEEYGPDDDEDDDDDDSFDETTLWEIANLLKSDKVPSRGSLFPEQEAGARQEPSAGAVRQHAHVSTMGSRNSETPSRAPSSGESSSRNQSTQAYLWDGKTSHTTTVGSIGLPQPEKTTWETYLTRPSETVRAPLRVSQPGLLASNTLWPIASDEPTSTSAQPAMSLWQSTVVMSRSRVAGPVDAAELKEQETVAEIVPFFLDVNPPWSQPTLTEPVRADLNQPDQTLEELHHAPESAPVPVGPEEATPVPIENEILLAPGQSSAASGDRGAVTDTCTGETGEISALWTPPVAAKAEESGGLFQFHHACHKIIGTSTEPAALEMRPNPRRRLRSLEELESTSLWSLPPKHSYAHDWISLSSMRPSTPEAMSSAWSSRSPFTDASSTHSSITGTSTTSGSLFTGCFEDTASSSSSQSVHGDAEAFTQGQARLTRPAQPASQAEWEAALAEALMASSSRSAAPVSAPLGEAAADCESSTPSGGIEASTTHPVLLTDDFDPDGGDVHPPRCSGSIESPDEADLKGHQI